MKIKCAWCQITINDYKYDNSDIVSHGICEKCEEKILKEIDSKEKKTKMKSIG